MDYSTIVLFVLIVLIFILEYNKQDFIKLPFQELKGYSDLLSQQNDWNYSVGGIPKIIIKTGRFKRDEMPKVIMDIFKSIIQDNPGYSLYYFDNDECDQFMKDYSESVFECYKQLIPGAYKADLFRVCLLEKYGGCYSDLGHVFLVPVDTIIEDYNMVLVKDRVLFNTNCNGIHNAFMCTTKSNGYFKRIIERICENVKNKFYGNGALDITGPVLLGDIYIDYYKTGGDLCTIKLNKNVFNGVKIKMLYLEFSFINNYLLKTLFITDDGKEIIRTKFDNYTEINYKSDGIKAYNQLWIEKKVYL